MVSLPENSFSNLLIIGVESVTAFKILFSSGRMKVGSKEGFGFSIFFLSSVDTGSPHIIR